jgi:ArsR family transcriptional regulator
MTDAVPGCSPKDHDPPKRDGPAYSPEAFERAGQLFRALGDASRLRILEQLAQGEQCVTALVQAQNEKFSTVSQRLRVLRSEGLVVRRRKGTHLYYALADRHVADLVFNALAHAAECGTAGPADPEEGD